MTKFHEQPTYALTIVDIASRYKEAEPLDTKEAKELADALFRIYRRSPLKWPNLLKVDPEHEFMGAVNQLIAKHDVEVRRGCVDSHRDQGSWSDSTGPWLIGILGTSMLCRCGSLLENGRLSG